MTDPITRLNAALEGRYRIERELGEGGMATVYLAHDERHNRSVALKVLKPELAAVVGAERFLAEIETTAQLTHPHILPLFDSGEADGFLFFVTPFIEGDTLRDKIDREKQLSVEEAVKTTEKVASALDYAHKQGVVHRDIKPGNILLSSTGEPTVADFGIALAVAQAGGGRVTETGLSVGTPHYMSPEQATGDRDVDPRTDVYALGSVLYEMLVGEPPYTGSTAQAILGKIIQGSPISATEARSTVPPNVDAAIRKALEKLPADRFGGAQEFARALGDPGFRHGEESAAAVAPARGLRAWALAATGLTVVFAAAFVYLLIRPEPSTIVARFESPFREGEVPTGAMELTPDGSALVYTGPGPSGSQLWIRRWENFGATPIPGTEGARVGGLGQLSLSPDGREVAFTTGVAGELRVVPLDGGPGRTLAENAAAVGAWSEDGWVYFQILGRAIYRVPETGGEAEVLTELTEGEVFHVLPLLLPNERTVVFQVFRDPGGQNSEIWSLDIETGQREMLTVGNAPRYAPTGHLLFGTEDGRLMAAPINVDRAELTGPSVPVAEGFSNNALRGHLRYTVSQTGALVYRAGNVGEGFALAPMWVERDGTAREIHPGWRALGAFNRSSLALSPDGTRLALSILDLGGRYDLWVKQLDTGPLSRVTLNGTENIRATWSRDGESLMYVSFGEGSNRDVLTKRADGSGTASVVLDREEAIWNALYSTDGNWLIFREGSNQAADIYAMRLPMDSVAVPLEVTEFQERYIALSPDDRWLAYVSNRSGRDEVYVRPFPDAGSSLWQVSTDGGVEPVWAHSGRELFYRNAANELVAVQVTGDPTFTSGEQEVLFSMADYLTSNGRAQYDISPDDQRFVMLRIEEQARDEVILVQNFFEELRQLAPQP